MKKLVWPFLWCGCILVCLTAGIMTRNSYTNLTADMNKVFSAPYLAIYNGIPQTISDTYSTICKKSELVVKGSVTGKRTYFNSTFETEVKILQVYQGNQTLQGKSITIYEPIRLEYQTLQTMQNSEEKEELIETISVRTPNDKFLVAKPSVESTLYRGLLQKNQYVFFLNAKKYASASKKANQNTEYNFADSVYSAIPLNIQKISASYPAPNHICTLEEGMNCGILLRDKNSLAVYFKTAEDIVKKLT